MVSKRTKEFYRKMNHFQDKCLSCGKTVDRDLTPNQIKYLEELYLPAKVINDLTADEKSIIETCFCIKCLKEIRNRGLTDPE